MRHRLGGVRRALRPAAGDLAHLSVRTRTLLDRVSAKDAGRRLVSEPAGEPSDSWPRLAAAVARMALRVRIPAGSPSHRGCAPRAWHAMGEPGGLDRKS